MVPRLWQVAAGGAFLLSVALVLLVGMPATEVSSANDVSFRINYNAKGRIVSIERYKDGQWAPITVEKTFKVKEYPLSGAGLSFSDSTHTAVFLNTKDPCVEQFQKLWCW
jgi:hypothetical protein